MLQNDFNKVNLFNPWLMDHYKQIYMPFLNALMPCATSPISSEIFPRPNSSRTTAMTMIQCQMLKEPMSLTPPGDGLARPVIWRRT